MSRFSDGSTPDHGESANDADNPATDDAVNESQGDPGGDPPPDASAFIDEVEKGAPPEAIESKDTIDLTKPEQGMTFEQNDDPG